MSWLRVGDNAWTYPPMLRVLPLGDDRTHFELYGFFTACYTHSANHSTDYLIHEGEIYSMGPRSVVEPLIKLALKSKIFTRSKADGMTVYKLSDDPNFMHLRLRSEIEWEQQQRADTSNPELTVPARVRDGDNCRYCGKLVSFTDKKSHAAGTYNRRPDAAPASFDHRKPGEAATVETLVVACNRCNSGRRNHESAEANYPLRPAPAVPYYSPRSVEFLAGHGISVTSAQRPAPADTATQRPAHADTAHSDRLRPIPRPIDPARRTPITDGSADVLPAGSGYTGSGRVGSGWVGSGSARGKRSARGRNRSRAGDAG